MKSIIGYNSSATQLAQNRKYSTYGYVSGPWDSVGSNYVEWSYYFYVPYTYAGDVSITCDVGASGTSSKKVGTGKVYLYDATEKKYIVSVARTTYGTTTKTVSATLMAGHYYHIYCYAYGYTYSNQGSYPTASAMASIAITGVTRASQNSIVSNVVPQVYDSRTMSPTPYKLGYDFLGWYDESDNLISEIWNYASNQSFHAKWEKHNYSIQYHLNGGINHISNPAAYDFEDSITLYDPTREGYTFGGWFIDEEFKNRITQIQGADGKNFILYAKWTANQYTATLDYDGGQNCPTICFYSNGELVKTQDLYKDSTINYFIPDAPNENSIFGGWYKDSSFSTFYSFSGVECEDISLYAKWISLTDVPYLALGSEIGVSIEGNEYQYLAIVSPINQTVTIESDSTLDLYGAVYGSQWKLLLSCDDISEDNLNFSISIRLQAGQIYYIGYKANQASVSGNATISVTGVNIPSTYMIGDYTEIIETLSVTYGKGFNLPTPKKEGCHFAGWYDENGILVDNSSWNYTESVTFHAVWE